VPEDVVAFADVDANWVFWLRVTGFVVDGGAITLCAQAAGLLVVFEGRALYVFAMLLFERLYVGCWSYGVRYGWRHCVVEGVWVLWAVARFVRRTCGVGT